MATKQLPQRGLAQLRGLPGIKSGTAKAVFARSVTGAMRFCPQCDAKFYVVWNNMSETQGGPDYCPFCGETIDYPGSLEKQEDTK